MNNYTEGYPDVTNNANIEIYYQLAQMLWKVWSPCLLVIGGFGNVATIFVLHLTKDHNSSQHVFLIALAVADLSCLCTYVVPQFLYIYFNARIPVIHTVTCKLYSWTKPVSFRLSAWLVTAVTVQRTLAIKWPHKVRVMCTVRRTSTVVAVLVFIAGALYSHLLVVYKLRDNACAYDVTANYVFFLRHIDKWIDMALNSFLPFVCILVCDVILSLSLIQATSNTSVANQAISSVPSVQSNNSRRETARRTTIMLLVLSISFVILTLPMRIVLIVNNATREQVLRNPELTAIHHLAYRGCRLLVCTNSAINFFLYCFTGTRFRKEFLNWICCRVEGPSSGSVGKTASGSSK